MTIPDSSRPHDLRHPLDLSRGSGPAGDPDRAARTTELFARLLATRTAPHASRVLLDHLLEVGNHRGAAVYHLHPGDGRLNGVVGVWDRGRPRVSEHIADPVAEPGPLGLALRDAARSRREPFDPGVIPIPYEGNGTLVIAPLRGGPGADADPAQCPRFDCPERGGRTGTCGAGSLPDEGWTRDQLVCGLLPVVGLVAVVADPDDPGGRRATRALEGLALEISPLFRNFRLQEALDDAEYFREDIFDSMTEGIIATGLGGDVLLVNRAAEELTGLERHEALGRPIETVLRETDVASSCVRESLRSGRTVLRVERTIRRGDGETVPVSLSTAPITARGWGMRGILVSFVDISPVKRMEQEIRRLDRLATIGRFTSSIAHEIRNPLGGILAGVQYLRGVLAEDPENARHIAFIESEIDRLNRIVEDLSSVTRTRRPNLGPCPLGDILERVEAAVAPLAEERKVRLSHLDEASPASCDPDQIHQVMLNLVKNGIEACDPGGWVRMTTRDVVEDGADLVVIDVTDDGAGIGPADVDQIFEPFYTTKSTGTGLGLFICHSIIEQHGGRLDVSGRKEGGTRFRLVLPAATLGEERLAS